MWARSVLTAALLSIACALPTDNTFAVKDSFNVPRQWKRVGTPPGDHTVRLNIGLKQSQFDLLEKHLWEVSDPDHPRYGDHLTSEQVDELIKPTDDSLDAVHEWLAGHGITGEHLGYNSAKDFIKVTLPVSAIEKMLDTEYSVYEHDDGDVIVRTPQWSLPKHLHDHIDSIQPTNSFLRSSPERWTVKPVTAIDADNGNIAWPDMAPQYQPMTSPTVDQVCNTSAVTSQCLRVLYGTYDYTPKAGDKNQVALTNYLGEANNRSDVNIFLQKYRPDAVPAAYTFNTEVINGGDNQQTPNTPAQNAAGKDLEGNLDAETILGITYPTKLTTYNTGGMPPFQPDLNTPTDTNEPYMVWLNYVLNKTSIPQTISTSYGDDEQTVPMSYAKTVCNQYAQLGVRGVTALHSSGDSGVGANNTCVSNDGKNTKMFIPAFPASCPYVTTVGATKSFKPEVAAFDPRNGFASGGGYSNYFGRPSYQNAAVVPYTASLGSQYKGLYNSSGRAYPDISAQGQRFITIWNGNVTLLDGTSASCPTAASVISLVNDALIAAGKKPLGFFNPFLYQVGYKAFTDVTSGSAIGCNSAGFPAKQGWDPVTGFGTPRFKDLMSLALAK